MLSPVSYLKQVFHGDIVRNPVTHGWVLNLYRIGERYPQTVNDYFPSEYAPTKELAQKIRQHGNDENRHAKMLEALLRQMQQPIVDMAGQDVFNECIRRETPVAFHITKTDTPKERLTKLAHFLAHAHCLEKRVARSLEYHIDACDRADKQVMANTISAILTDEKRHIAYTKEAVESFLPRHRLKPLFEVHQRAEARANFIFSKKQVASYLTRYPGLVNKEKKILYRYCNFMMGVAARCV